MNTRYGARDQVIKAQNIDIEPNFSLKIAKVLQLYCNKYNRLNNPNAFLIKSIVK